MTKRLIDVDDELLAKATEALGTRTMKATVNTALAEVARAQLRRRHADRLARMKGLDLTKGDVMAGAWRH
jgi:Arc/MetJ family transcription regulator